MNSRALLTTFAASCILLFTSSLKAQLIDRDKEKSNLSREPGAIYFEDFLKEPVRLHVLKEVPIYATAERKRAVGTLKAPRAVEVLAMTDKGYRVRGLALHGQVAGWVLASELDSEDPEFAINLRKLYERQVVVQDLIANAQVAIGMTIDEVKASLGKPDRKSSKLDKTGRSDVYEYVTYEKIPQYQYVRDAYGNMIRKVYYIKVETGKVAISFKDELVESIEEKEGEPQLGKLKIIPVPIELF